jgi:hypothetical protein
MSEKLTLVKLANSVRVGTDDMLTVTSIGHGLGRFDIELLDDGVTIVIKHLRMQTTTYTTIYNCIYYQKPEVSKDRTVTNQDVKADVTLKSKTKAEVAKLATVF